MELNEREYYRISLSAKATCYFSNGKEIIRGDLKDLSIDGCFIETDNHAISSEECEMKILLIGKHSNVAITDIAVKVLRREENGIAVKFDHHFEWIAFAPIIKTKFPG